MDRPKPVILVILDGWGIAPASKSNAISQAKTPVIDSLVTSYPAMTLQASGQTVGLPWGERGNSEVGHLSLGSGKIVYQSFPRITQSIWDKSFFENEAFLINFSAFLRLTSGDNLLISNCTTAIFNFILL